ncbi:Reverse transcriptase domain [Lasallia pustulata]|uniref:Reverse transcriptase domain n=1 Tax=Lasallia pustulata TaxID=136370 RepID=A0A1W5DDU0_9LECA|nr:Reverse transcriptase domain [Lasallia pustulata]
MPFGLTNAPATFQAFIDKALREFLDITWVVYLDDILIFSKDESDHEEHNYSRIAAPLLNLLKTGKNKKEIGVKVQQTDVVPPQFPLSKTALEAFKALKEAFTSVPLLQYFDKNKPMRVEMDASAFAIGGILTQQFEINSHLHWLPVTYYSKKLLDTETQYGTGEQELLAIVEAMHHWRHYCQGARHPIVVLTD